jgi:hypothetical protein
MKNIESLIEEKIKENENLYIEDRKNELSLDIQKYKISNLLDININKSYTISPQFIDTQKGLSYISFIKIKKNNLEFKSTNFNVIIEDKNEDKHKVVMKLANTNFITNEKNNRSII